MHLPFGSQSQSAGYPYTQQYPSPSSSSQSPYRPNNVYSHPPYSSSSVQSLPLTPPSGSAIPSVQNPNQPVIIPLNGGGFVILPPGQQVQVIVSTCAHVHCYIYLINCSLQKIIMVQKGITTQIRTTRHRLSLGVWVGVEKRQKLPRGMVPRGREERWSCPAILCFILSLLLLVFYPKDASYMS